METYSFSILKEDYDNSGKSYTNTSDCPATIAFKRQFPDRNPITLTLRSVVDLGKENKSLYIGSAKHSWSAKEFYELAHGKEFHTTITFN